MRKILSLVGVTIFSLTLCTAAVYGWSKGGGHGHRGGFGGPGGKHSLLSPFMLKKLDLTEQQEGQIQQIREARRPAFKKLRDELRALHTQIGDKFYAPGDVQSEDFAAQFEQAARLQQQLMQEGFATTLEIRQVLTAAQLAKANELRNKFRALHKEMQNLDKDDL